MASVMATVAGDLALDSVPIGVSYLVPLAGGYRSARDCMMALACALSPAMDAFLAMRIRNNLSCCSLGSSSEVSLAGLALLAFLATERVDSPDTVTGSPTSQFLSKTLPGGESSCVCGRYVILRIGRHLACVGGFWHWMLP
jgi:hypothetical protein